MRIPVPISARLLVYWISGILISFKTTTNPYFLLIACCSWLLIAHYRNTFFEELALAVFIVLASAFTTGMRAPTTLQNDHAFYAVQLTQYKGKSSSGKTFHYLAESLIGQIDVYSIDSLAVRQTVSVHTPSRPGYNQKQMVFLKPGSYELIDTPDGLLTEQILPKKLLFDLKNWVSNRWKQLSMPARSRGLMASLILGERSELDPIVKEHFKILGISHILAISGLHFALLYLAFKSISLLLPHRLRRGVRLALTLTFASLVGWSPSVSRAALFILLYEVGGYLGRPVNRIHLLCITALISLVFEPDWLFSVGFWLSYSAVLGIFLALPFFELVKKKKAIWRYLIEIVGISIAAQLAVTPIIALVFEELSIFSTIASAALTPIVPLMLLTSVLSLAGGLFATLTAQFFSLLLAAIKWAAELVDQPIQVCTSTVELTAYYTLYLYLMYIAHKALHKWREQQYE